MKTAKRTITGIMATFAILAAVSAWAGDLTPPGAPGSTMKTLDQVEPRIPITQSDMPLTISAPGSYYFTTNLIGVSGSAGITITSDDVTLDLMGFTLRGVAGSQEGITVPATRHNITIRNGVVREWGYHGVDALDADNSSLENLKAFTNGWESTGRSGLRIGQDGRVSGCQAEANQTVGIVGGIGSTITDSTAYKNGVDGIYAAGGSTVRRCTAQYNTGDGIHVYGDCTVTANTCDSNGYDTGDGAGIHATSADNRIEDNNVTDNDRGIDVDSSGNIIVRNTASGNTTNYDIDSGNSVGGIVDVSGGGFTNTNPWANFAF